MKYTGLKMIIGLTLLLFISACNNNPFEEEPFEETSFAEAQFEYQADKVEVGTTYHFTISNKDGSYHKNIALHVVDTNRIESFKLYKGADKTFVVSADMDWNLFSIQNIQQVEMKEDLVKKTTINIDLKGRPENAYSINNTIEVPVGLFPAFNHGYDFSDLNFAFRHIKNPESDIKVGIIAPVGNTFAYTGAMIMSYKGVENYNNRPCYKYELGGTGISEREGYLLVNKDAGHFEYMELDANYHPQMDYFRYELLSISTMNKEEWDRYVMEESKKHFDSL